MNEQMKYQQDLRLYGRETADELARLRNLVAENRRLIEISVSRESNKNLGLPVPVLAEPINRKPSTEAVVEVGEAQSRTQNNERRGLKAPFTTAADKPLNPRGISDRLSPESARKQSGASGCNLNVKSIEHYL